MLLCDWKGNISINAAMDLRVYMMVKSSLINN